MVGRPSLGSARNVALGHAGQNACSIVRELDWCARLYEYSLSKMREACLDFMDGGCGERFRG